MAMTQENPPPQTSVAQFPQSRRTPLRQILHATWASLLFLLLSAAFIFAVAASTNGKPKSGIWTSNASVFIAAGAIVLKGSVGALLGAALYQHLWLRLSNASRNDCGLTVNEIESLHLASRLTVGMITQPSISIAWFVGLVSLLATSAMIPAIQAGVDTVNHFDIIPVTVKIEHAQLDYRMAQTGSGIGFPQQDQPHIRRSATVAVFGENSTQAYTKRNLTGMATFGPIDYADVDCSIKAIAGPLIQARGSFMPFYNFTSTFTDYVTVSLEQGRTSTDDFPGSLEFNATMHNETHYLIHNCKVRPARGVCRTRISGGAGVMKDLSCTRQTWMDPIPPVREGPVTGFYGVAYAFKEIFRGEASASGTQMRPWTNCTFIEATAVFADWRRIYLGSEMLSHVQRTLWHTPINARPPRVPENQTGGLFDLNSTIDMVVNSENPVLTIKIDYTVLGTVVGVGIVLGVGAVLYLIVAENEGLGRLMRDSLVHSLTVAGANGPGIPNACMAGLQAVLDTVGSEKLVYGVVTQAIPGYLGHLAIQNASVLRTRYTLPIPRYWYGGPKKMDDKEHMRASSSLG